MKRLNDRHILVTRPAHQAHGLIRLLSERGAFVLLFPTLLIQPVDDEQRLTAQLQSVIDHDWYIFISPNSVTFSIPHLMREKQLTNMAGQFATVGAGTKDALTPFGIHDVIYPLEGVGAEALLNTLQYEILHDKKIAIFKGDSHNETLEAGLKARGAHITPITCYQRVRAEDDPTPLIHAFEHQHLDVIVTTSGDGLKNLMTILPEAIHAQAVKTPVVVVSERVQRIAKDFGFQHILLSPDASDEHIVATIESWHNEGAPHD